MGNCIKTPSYAPSIVASSGYDSPGSLPDIPEWGGFPESMWPPLPVSPKIARFADMPKVARSMVQRYLDVPSMQNVRCSGKTGAALCRSVWCSNADELQRVLTRFNPQGIDGITLDGPKFTDADMQMLPTTLTRLTLLNQTRRSHITEAGFAHLSGMPLRQLDLSGYGAMNDGCMTHLRGMPLEEVRFSLRSDVTDIGLENFRDAPLRQLSASINRRITDAGIAHVSLQFLDKLKLQGCKKITDATLERVTNSPLRQLEVDFCSNITNQGIKSLRGSAVQSLGLSGCVELTSACFDDLCAMPSLKQLRMFDCPRFSPEEMDTLKVRLRQKNPAFEFEWGSD